MERITLKPAEGMLVWLEDGSGYLPPEGQAVPPTVYYRRRLADGDLIDITEEAAASTQAASEAAVADHGNETEAAYFAPAVTEEAEQHA